MSSPSVLPRRRCGTWIGPFKKSAMRLAGLHRRIRDIRQDFLHKFSTHLAKTKSVIVVEDLNVSGMLRNRRLARHIADVGWGAFRRMLAYKCTWYVTPTMTGTQTRRKICWP